MLSLLDMQDILGWTFFDGSTQIAGIAMYVAVLAIMFVFCKNKGHALILAMPITLIFSLLGVLDSSVTVLLIIVIALSLAFQAKRVF